MFLFPASRKRKNDAIVGFRSYRSTLLSLVILSTIGFLWWTTIPQQTSDLPSAHLLYWQDTQGISLNLQTGKRTVFEGRPSDDASWLKLSPDGTWAARWSRDDECCTWSLHIYEGVNGPNRGFGPRFGGGDPVSWMPDSEWIAFSAEPLETTSQMADVSRKELYLGNIYTKQVKRMTDNTVMDSGPSLSPDGKTIAYTSHGDGHNLLYLMDVATQTSHVLTVDVEGYNAAWSPDGTWIAFMSKCGRESQTRSAFHGSIWIIRADGTDLQKIQSGADFIELRWLP